MRFNTKILVHFCPGKRYEYLGEWREKWNLVKLVILKSEGEFS